MKFTGVYNASRILLWIDSEAGTKDEIRRFGKARAERRAFVAWKWWRRHKGHHIMLERMEAAAEFNARVWR